MSTKNIKLVMLGVIGLGVIVSYQNCGQIQPGLKVSDSAVLKQDNTRAIIQDGNGNIDAVILIDTPAPIPESTQPAVNASQPAVDVITDEPAVITDAPAVAGSSSGSSSSSSSDSSAASGTGSGSSSGSGEVPSQQPAVIADVPVAVSQQGNGHAEEGGQGNQSADSASDVKDHQPASVLDVASNSQHPIDAISDEVSVPEANSANANCAELAIKYAKQAIDISKADSLGKLSVLKGKTFIYSSTGNVSLKEVDIGLSCGRTILCGIHVDKITVKKGRLDLIRSTVGEIVESKGTVKVFN